MMKFKVRNVFVREKLFQTMKATSTEEYQADTKWFIVGITVLAKVKEQH